MARNTQIIPFTEAIERIQVLGRQNAETYGRIRAVLNDVYTSEIPREYDWHWLKSSSAIVCIAEYDTGVVTVSTNGTTCTFDSGATITSAMTGRKIKFDNNADIYDLTFLDSTGGTISPSLSGTTNIDSGGYSIFQPIYSLPSDFDRWPVNGGLLFYQGGQPRPLPELNDDDYYEQAVASPTSTPDSIRPLGYDTAGNLQFEMVPPPSQQLNLFNEYLRSLLPMTETTAGTIVVTSGGTLLSGTDTLFTQAKTGDYVRATGFGRGADSTWYRINAITNDTTATISTFRADSSYSGSYAISAAPEMPHKMHQALIYGALEKLLPDHNDPMWQAAHMQYARILTDNKVLIQSRNAKDDVELIAEDPEYRR